MNRPAHARLCARLSVERGHKPRGRQSRIRMRMWSLEKREPSLAELGRPSVGGFKKGSLVSERRSFFGNIARTHNLQGPPSALVANASNSRYFRLFLFQKLVCVFKGIHPSGQAPGYLETPPIRCTKILIRIHTFPSLGRGARQQRSPSK